MSTSIRRILAACLAPLVTTGIVLAAAPSASAADWARATPTGLEQTATSSSSITLRWDAVSKAPRYRLQVATDPSMSGATYHRFTGTTGTVKNLKKSTTYYVKVRVITADGGNLSAYSAAVEAPTTFSTPSSLVLDQATASSLSFGWKAVSGAPRYRVQLARSSSMSGATYHRFWDAEGTVSGLAPDTTYYAKVRVISDVGLNLSPYSSTAVKVRTAKADTGGAEEPPAGDPPRNLRTTAVATTMAALDWDDRAGATGYTVAVSRSASMSSPTTTTATSSATQLAGLAPGTTHHVTVRAVGAGGAAVGPATAPLAVKTPATGFAALTPTGLTVGTTTNTSATLTWNPVVDAPRYRLQVARSADMADATYVRVDPTTHVLDGLEANSTYHVKVRVITDAGDNLSEYSPAVTLRTTAKAEPLEIASYNVRCANCYAGTNSERPWAERRAAVVSTITSRMPDVIGIQEASQGWLEQGGKKVDLAQFEDLRNRLRSAGAKYEVTDPDRNNCAKSTTPSSCSYKDQGASQGTKIFYNTDTVTLESSGSKKLPQCSGCNERYVAWGIFTQKASGERFFVADTHLEPGSDKYSLRKSQAETMMAEVAKRNAARLPAFVVGDFNSTRYFSPTNAPYDAVVAAGFVDPLGHTYKSPKISSKATAETRVRANYNSFNDFSRSVVKYGESENGSNIDYILTTPMRTLAWETVMDLDASGKLAGVIPSDHHMLVTTVLLP